MKNPFRINLQERVMGFIVVILLYISFPSAINAANSTQVNEKNWEIFTLNDIEPDREITVIDSLGSRKKFLVHSNIINDSMCFKSIFNANRCDKELVKKNTFHASSHELFKRTLNTLYGDKLEVYSDSDFIALLAMQMQIRSYRLGNELFMLLDNPRFLAQFTTQYMETIIKILLSSTAYFSKKYLDKILEFIISSENKNDNINSVFKLLKNEWQIIERFNEQISIFLINKGPAVKMMVNSEYSDTVLKLAEKIKNKNKSVGSVVCVSSSAEETKNVINALHDKYDIKSTFVSDSKKINGKYKLKIQA